MGSEVHEFTLTPALAMCPTVTPRTPHLDTLRAKRLQFFSGTQSSHDVLYHAPSTSNPSEAPREGVSTPQAGLCDLPVSQSNGPVSQNDGPVSQSKGPVSLDLLQDEAGLDLLLLQDSAVPEHRKLRHVLAWAQNFIRTGPAIGPSEPWSREDHRTALKSDHVTSAKTAHVPPIYGDQVTQPKGNRVTRTTIEESTRQVLQSQDANFTLQLNPLSQPHSLSKSHPHSQPQPLPQPHPLSQPYPVSQPRPLSQPHPDPQSQPRPFSQPHPHPQSQLRSLSKPRVLPQPGLSVYETYLMCAARLSGGEPEGRAEPQLPGKQEAGGLRQRQHHTSGSERSYTATFKSSLKCDSAEGSKLMSDCFTPSAPVSPGESAEQAEESLHDSGDSTTADLSADCVTKEIHVAACTDSVKKGLHVTSSVDHVTSELRIAASVDHVNSELCIAAGGVTSEAPVQDTGSGVQEKPRCPAEGRRRVAGPAGQKPEVSQPTRISSSGSSRRRRFWEKSSLLWSSYPEGALLPRSRPFSESFAKSCTPPHDSAFDSAPPANAGPPPQGPGPSVPPQSYMQAGGAVLIPWLSLPDELWMAILKLLPPGDLSCVAQTCHRLCGLANDRTLWEVVKIENSTCLNSDWLSSIGRRGPHSLTLYRCTDAHVTQWGLEQLFAQSKGSLRELRITRCSGPGLHGDRLLLPCSLHCPRLTDVDVSWTGATDAGISALASATTSLRGVVLNGCCITDTAIKILIRKHGASLCRLEVFGCRNLSAACLSAMATSCPNLKVLNVGKLPRVTETCLTHISTRLKQLTSLNLTGLPEVRDRSVHLIARRCPELRSLTLRCCPNVTDRSLTEIGTYSATIRYLDVSGCSAVTDLGVQAIAMACCCLQYLDLSSTKISNKGVRLLASHCSTHLHTLKLSFCYICQDSLRKLCQRCKGLRLLHLYGACDFHSSQELRDINQYLETKCDLTCA